MSQVEALVEPCDARLIVDLGEDGCLRHLRLAVFGVANHSLADQKPLSACMVIRPVTAARLTRLTVSVTKRVFPFKF